MATRRRSRPRLGRSIRALILDADRDIVAVKYEAAEAKMRQAWVLIDEREKRLATSTEALRAYWLDVAKSIPALHQHVMSMVAERKDNHRIRRLANRLANGG